LQIELQQKRTILSIKNLKKSFYYMLDICEIIDPGIKRF